MLHFDESVYPGCVAERIAYESKLFRAVLLCGLFDIVDRTVGILGSDLPSGDGIVEELITEVKVVETSEEQKEESPEISSKTKKTRRPNRGTSKTRKPRTKKTTEEKVEE